MSRDDISVVQLDIGEKALVALEEASLDQRCIDLHPGILLDGPEPSRGTTSSLGQESAHKPSIWAVGSRRIPRAMASFVEQVDASKELRNRFHQLQESL